MLIFLEAGKLSLDRLAEALVESQPPTRAGDPLHLGSVVLVVEASPERVRQVFRTHGLDCDMASLPAEARERVVQALDSQAVKAGPAAVTEMSAHLHEPPLFPGMSERDREVVRLVVEGLSNKEIGARLDLPETSIKRALQRVFDHCGVRTRGQVVRLVMERRMRANGRSSLVAV